MAQKKSILYPKSRVKEWINMEIQKCHDIQNFFNYVVTFSDFLFKAFPHVESLVQISGIFYGEPSTCLTSQKFP